MMAAHSVVEPVHPPLILIVEDQTVVAMDIERSVRALGYVVLARTTRAEDAIRRARVRRPDLILMDIRLPGPLDGIGAAKIIRDELHIPVIFLSAFSDPETLGSAKLTEPFGYIVKPFKEAELRCAIELALHRSRGEKSARQRERLLETTLRSIGDGVVTTNGSGRITSLNRVAEDLTGWTSADAAGRQLSDVLRLEDELTREPVEVPLREAMVQGSVTYLQPGTVLLSKNGNRIPIEDSAAAIVDIDSTRLGGVVVFRDVSARRKAEGEAARLGAHYRRFFEDAEDGIRILATDGTLLEANHRPEEQAREREAVAPISPPTGERALRLRRYAFRPRARRKRRR